MNVEPIGAPLSASKLKLHERCPEQYRLRYEERVPEGPPTKYLRIGNAVHDSIEHVLKDLDDYADAGLMEERFKAAFRHYDFSDGHDLAKEDRQTVRTCLENAAKYVAKRDPAFVHIEGRVEFLIDRPTLTHPATGFIDVATEGPDEVWDWKTGKSEGKTLDETLQGAVYMAGYYERYALVPEAIRFVYLKEGVVHTHEPSDELWDVLLGKARKLIAAAEAGEFPGDPEDSKCYWCDFQKHCTTSPNGVGNIDAEVYP